MHQAAIVSTGVPLSPGFDRARQISRLLAVLLAIGFWVTLAFLVTLPVLLIWPVAGRVEDSGLIFDPAALSLGHRAGAILAILLGTAPSLFVLHHAARAFIQFAKSEVFVARAIAHIRSAGFWLTIAGFATGVEQVLFNLFTGARPIAHQLSLRPTLLFVGLAVYVMAYVMSEAQRIAADNASIV